MFHDIPIRQDLTVLGADDQKTCFLDWTIKEHSGFEIFKLTDELKSLSNEEIYDDRYWPVDKHNDPIHHKIITAKDDLKAGDIIVGKSSLEDYLWGDGVVKSDENGKLHVIFDCGNMGILEFDTDNRHCWVCTGLINMACFDKCCMGEIKNEN